MLKQIALKVFLSQYDHKLYQDKSQHNDQPYTSIHWYDKSLTLFDHEHETT